jgi:hypothetical protein
VQVAVILFSCYWLAVLGLLAAGRPSWALGAVLLKIALQGVTALAASRRAGLPMPAWYLVAGFEFYSLALTTHLTLLRLLGKRGVEWKGRHYQ